MLPVPLVDSTTTLQFFKTEAVHKSRSREMGSKIKRAVCLRKAIDLLSLSILRCGCSQVAALLWGLGVRGKEYSATAG